MYTFLLVLLVLNSLVLIAAVLLQSGKGSGLSANFGGASSSSDSFVGTRQAATLLTRITWWGGGIFLALAFVLQIMGTRPSTPTSVLDPLSRQTTAAPAAPAPTNAPSAVPLTPITPAQQPPAAPPTKTPPK
ncbi:MAG: preprotein translocase subunit SecG [Gemmatimonadaceae bacterium]|nr:preprotein translocase subunit SecG [Gemmatimonadaceae bacterium]